MQAAKKISGFTAVSVEVASSMVRDVQASMKLAGFLVDSVDTNMVLLRDVKEQELHNVRAIAESFGGMVAGTFGPKVFVEYETVKIRKAFKLNLEPNVWYFAENQESIYPFVVIRDTKIEKIGNNGDEDQIFEMDFYGPDHSLPIRQSVSSRVAVGYGLRPATEEDFEAVDMIVPVDDTSALPLKSDNQGIPRDIPAVQETPQPSASGGQVSQSIAT